MATHNATERVVAVGYAILALLPFGIAMTQHSFYERAHSIAWVAVPLFVGLVGALVVGRYRWAWVLLVVFGVSVIVRWAIDLDHPAWFALYVLSFGLLVSAPMRRRLRRPIWNSRGARERIE
jgi:hypothetical protein